MNAEEANLAAASVNVRQVSQTLLPPTNYCAVPCVKIIHVSAGGAALLLAPRTGVVLISEFI